MDLLSSSLVILLLGVLVVLGINLFRRDKTLDQLQNALNANQRELRHTAQVLNTLRQRLAALADATFEAIIVVNADREIIAINHAARDLFPVEGDSVGKTLMSVVRHHELDGIAETALKTEDTLESQVAVGDRTLRVRGTAIDSRTQPVVVLAMQDITELLRLARARRDMVANFSHDLRTPISSIRLLVDTLTTNLGKNPDRDARLIGKIASETDSLQHMTQELIDLSMIESGQAIMRLIAVEFTEVVNSAIEIMATQIEQKKLDLAVEMAPGLRVLIDPDQTRRVLTNLIHNSIKFTPSGGHIRVEATCDAQMVTVRVRDTGSGIPPQDRTRVFERFYQVDASRSGSTKKNSGSGLGLAIAKHIVEAQGGSIWAEANIPTGACIVFTLPLALASEPHTPKTESPVSA